MREKHVFTAPTGGLYCIYHRFYNPKKGKTIEIEFVEEANSPLEALKKVKQKILRRIKRSIT